MKIKCLYVGNFITMNQRTLLKRLDLNINPVGTDPLTLTEDSSTFDEKNAHFLLWLANDGFVVTMKDGEILVTKNHRTETDCGSY